MIKVAENSLKNHPKLKNVTILGHTPRYDSREIDPAGLKPNIAHFANNYLLELWLYSPLKDKIHIGNHNLECSGAVRAQRYTDGRTGRHDGVHMYGEAGKKAYSESLLNVLLTSFQECDPKSSGVDKAYDINDSFHKTCPQTEYKRYQQQQKFKYQARKGGKVENEARKPYRTWSSVVAGIKLQNRFSPLGN